MKLGFIPSLLLILTAAGCATPHEHDRFEAYASRAFEQRHIDQRYRREFMTSFRDGVKEVVIRRYLNDPESADTAQWVSEDCRAAVEHSFSDEHQAQAGSCGYVAARQFVAQNGVGLAQLGYTSFSGAARLENSGGRESLEPFYFLSVGGEEISIYNLDSIYPAFVVGDCLSIEGYLGARHERRLEPYVGEMVVRRADKVDTSRCS